MYKAKATDLVNDCRKWGKLLVEIFKDEEKIGEYERNYGSLFNTFAPFEQNGQYYALYSKDYTATRIMSLPDCKDIGSEEPHAHGFCPVDYYVPQLRIRKFEKDEIDPKPYNPRHDPNKWATITNGIYNWSKSQEYKDACQKHDEEYKIWNEKHPYIKKYADWGFIAGCYWGADFAWQIMFLDLSEASKGIIKKDTRFGDIWLPSGVELKNAIDTSGFNVDDPCVEIALPIRYKLTGELDDKGLIQFGEKNE